MAFNLESIKPPSEPPPTDPDPKTEFELAQHNVELHALERASFRQDIGERKSYANKIFGLICAWLLAMFLVIVVDAIPAIKFDASEKVLLALIGGTTVNVLGLFAIVANYLFPRRPSK